MTKTLGKFLNNIKKLEDYFILREEDNYLILGKEILIKEHKEIAGNIFQPYSKNIERPIFICFIINITEDRLDLWRYEGIPTLYVQPKVRLYSVANIKKYLDDFLIETFQ